MKFAATITFILITILLASCECEEYKCPAFSNTDKGNWLPNNDSLHFRNAANGDVIHFGTQQKHFSDAYGEDETILRFSSCKNNDCIATATFNTTTAGSAIQPAINISIHLTNIFNGKQATGTRLEYNIGDMSSEINVSPNLSRTHLEATDDWYTDSIKDINTGSIIYPNVLIQTRKVNATKKVVKTYWCTGYGLIAYAFDDGATYWLQ